MLLIAVQQNTVITASSTAEFLLLLPFSTAEYCVPARSNSRILLFTPSSTAEYLFLLLAVQKNDAFTASSASEYWCYYQQLTRIN